MVMKKQVCQDQSQHSQKDSHLTPVDQRSRECEQKKHRRKKHRIHQSHGTPPSNADHNHMHVVSTSDSQVQDRLCHPPPTIGGWVTPEDSSSVHLRKYRDSILAQVVEGSPDNQPLKNTQQPLMMVTVEPDRTLNSTSSAGGLENANCNEESIKSPPLIKSLSPRAQREIKKLQSKQIELRKSKEEKQRLVNELNLLNLKVQEEGTK